MVGMRMKTREQVIRDMLIIPQDIISFPTAPSGTSASAVVEVLTVSLIRQSFAVCNSTSRAELAYLEHDDC